MRLRLLGLLFVLGMLSARLAVADQAVPQASKPEAIKIDASVPAVDLELFPPIPDRHDPTIIHERRALVEDNVKLGKIVWDPAKIELFTSPHQAEEKYKGPDYHFTGAELRPYVIALANKTQNQPLNAAVLDYLLIPEHRHLIPKEWKGKQIFFWGTVYYFDTGDGRPPHQYIRYLCWQDEVKEKDGSRTDKWGAVWYALEHDFHETMPAAILKKK